MYRLNASSAALFKVWCCITQSAKPTAPVQGEEDMLQPASAGPYLALHAPNVVFLAMHLWTLSSCKSALEMRSRHHALTACSAFAIQPVTYRMLLLKP